MLTLFCIMYSLIFSHKVHWLDISLSQRRIGRMTVCFTMTTFASVMMHACIRFYIMMLLLYSINKMSHCATCFISNARKLNVTVPYTAPMLLSKINRLYH